MLIRLDKMLSHMNLGSRKEVKKYIREGFVLVNGKVIYDDDFKVDTEVDDIIFDDFNIDYNEFVYIMLNKPKDIVSATFDPRYMTVCDLVPEYQKMNIFPVGRLDIDTEGLLILTNDGKLAHKLLSPKYHVTKKYYVLFEGNFKDEYHNILSSGVVIDDGYKCLPAKVDIIDKNKCYIYITEGKFHQVKRMFEALYMKVIYLKRVEFKNIVLDPNLELGKYRMLTSDEIKGLKEE